MKKLLAYMLVAVMLLSYIPVVSFAADSNISSKLLAEYNFDDQTTNNSDGSKHAVIGTSVSGGKADYEDGVSGKALKLTEAGSSEKYWLNIPYSVFENNTDSFTISLWYKATGYNTSGQDSELFSLYNSSAEKFLFYSPTMISNNNWGYTMKWAGSGTYGYANTSSMSHINQWTHLVYTVEAVENRSVIKMYVNGEQITATQSGHWDDSLMSLLGVDTFTIGGYNKWKGGSACSVYGSVDEIRLYAGALTKEEAKQLYDENAGNMPEVDESEQLKILAIGNSFSIDATTYLWDVMKDGGYSNHTVAVAYIGGSALDDHWGNIQNDKPAYEYWKNTNGVWTTSPGCTLLEILTAEQWDIITLQQQSLKAGQPSTFSNLEGILDFVYANKTNNDAKVYWHMTWGYPSANPDSEYKALYNNDQMAMYNAIVSTVQSKIVENSRFAGIIPSGTAIQNLRSSYLGDILCRDTVHLSEDQGRYTAAMMWYAYLLNGDISKIDWVPSNYGYVANDLPAIREAILDALANPFAVSQCTSARVGKAAQDGDLIGQWNFDNSNTKDSVGNYHGTLWNNASVATGTYVDGVSGKALKLSTRGTDEKYWLDIPYSVFGGNQNSFTISLWYNSAGHNTSGENSELFSLYNKAGERFLFYGAQMDGNKNAFTMKWDGTYGYANVIGGYKENEWVHLVFSVDASDGQSKITAYINGKAVEVDQGGAWANSLMSQLGINAFTIGGKNPYKGGTTPKCLFYGAVDEVQLYAGTLSEDKAAELYNAVANAPAGRGELLAEYNFNDQTTNDSVGIHNATFYNNATATAAGYVDGISGKALKLSTQGTDEKYWLGIPYSVFGGNTDSYTISLWYNSTGHNSSGENSELFSLYNSSAEKFLFYGAMADGSKNAFTMKWDGTYGYANVIGGYKENEWVHLVFAVDNVNGQSKITAYINGKAVAVDQGGAWAGSLMSQMGINTFTIGGKNPYKGGAIPKCLFYGSVDEVQIYAGALTASEAKAIYDQVTSEPVQRGELLAEYNFDDQTTNDGVGGNDATFYNNATATNANYVDGISGKALQLSTQGTDEKYWLNVPYSAFGSSTDSFTLSLWYNSTGHNTSGENSELFSLYNSGAEKFLFYGAQADGNQNAMTMKWDSTYGYANVIGGYKENEWVHLVYIVDNVNGQSKITAYVNGKVVKVDQGGAWAGSLMSQMGINTFTIGGKNPYKGGATPKCLFYGSVDEVQLYAGALTHAEALALYEENAAMWVNPDPVEDYAYSFAVVGDTQIISYEDPDNLHNIYDWIIENKENENIQFVFGLGDITDKDTDAEWIIAKEQIHRMDGVVPYSVVRGNHDGSGQYNKYFPYSDYADMLAGSYDETMFNTFQKLTVADTKYLIVNLDVGASDEVLAWANDVVAAHSDYNVIVTTHAYLDYDGSWIDESSYVAPTVLGFPNNGDDIWEKFVRKHANISMVLCGHMDNDDITVTTAVGDHGNTVTQMLIDPQGLDAGYGSTGMVAMLYFSEDGKQVDVRYYSTIREGYFKDVNQFTMQMPGITVGDGMGVVSQRQVLLGDDIGMKLYAELNEKFVCGSGMYAKITVGDAEQKIMLSDMEPQKIDGKSYYVFTANVAAAQMTEEITLQLFNGADEGGQVYTCTVRDYLTDILDSQKYAASHQIASQLLNYGAKAQTYFNVNTDKLADAGYEIQTENSVPQKNMEPAVSGSVSGITFYGAALVFEHRIAVRFYFAADNGVQGYTFTANGKTYTPVKKGDMYYVEISGINPQAYDEVIELTVADGNSAMGIGYSPLHYIVRMYGKAESAQLRDLLDALYNYHLTAQNYNA